MVLGFLARSKSQTLFCEDKTHAWLLQSQYYQSLSFTSISSQTERRQNFRSRASHKVSFGEFVSHKNVEFIERMDTNLHAAFQQATFCKQHYPRTQNQEIVSNKAATLTLETFSFHFEQFSTKSVFDQDSYLQSVCSSLRNSCIDDLSVKFCQRPSNNKTIYIIVEDS